MRTFIEAFEPRRMLDAGQLDTTFGNAGAAHVDFSSVLAPGYTANLLGFAEDRNGYLYVLAKDFRAVHSTSAHLLIARLTPLGNLDAHFANAGVLALPLQGSGAQHIAVDRQSRPYVTDGNRIYRFTTTGRFDSTFGHTGKATIPKIVTVHQMQVDDDARVYVDGADHENIAENNQSLVIRLTAGGRLDGSWATRGMFTVPLPAAANPVFTTSLDVSMQTLTNNRLLVAAQEKYRSVPNDPVEEGEFVNQVLVTRLDEDGAVDPTYGDDGTKLVSQRDTLVQFFGFNIDRVIPDGSVIADKSWSFDDPDVDGGREIYRISADGKHAPINVTSPTDATLAGGAGEAITYQHDGKLIGANGTQLYRLNVDGTLDRTFGNGGVIASTFTGTASLLSDGTFFVLGSPTSSKYWSSDSAVAQLVGSSDLTQSRGGALSFTVNWRDDDGVDESSITSGDLFAERADGSRRSLRLASVTQIQTGVFQAVYKLTSDDGTWDSGDNGTYSIHTRSREVTDVNGVRNSSALLGSFVVAIS